MRDIRDAKAMAQTLRQELAHKATITNSESLELVSHLFGVADWNTLSALTQSRSTGDREQVQSKTYPAMPVRDLAPFPMAQLPLYLKRDNTLRALDAAFAARRQVVLVAQRSPDVKDPRDGDVYRVGTLAQVLDIGPPSEDAVAQAPMLAGSTEVLLQPHRRVRLLSFTGSDDGYAAAVTEIEQPPVPDARELIRTASASFDLYAKRRGLPIPPQWVKGYRHRDPGRFADLLAMFSPGSVAEKQALLEIIDPVSRLEKLVAIMDAN